MSDWRQKIELGSAQFGLDYGVNNGKKVSHLQCQSIHQVLYDNGAHLIDTAASYGDSENVVASIMQTNTQVVSKLLPLTEYSTKTIIQGIENSFTVFGDHLVGLMVHNAQDVYDPRFKTVIDYLNSVRSPTLKIGVSVYDPMDVLELDKIMTLDMIQIPFNILDQRACNETFITFVKHNNIDVHARSVFLQGLLLMDENTPKGLRGVTPYRDAVRQTAQLQNISVYQLCMLYVFQQTWINHVVIGLDNLQQACSLIDAVNTLPTIKCDADFAALACGDINIINPAKWTYDH